MSEEGKILSKNALYAPLAAYEQTTVEPANYSSQQSKVPKSTMESSLTTFLQQVSQDYHRKIARPQDPKNNGSRPQSLTDVDRSIRQKAVTLVGGGVTNSSTLFATKAKGTKKRRRSRSFAELQSKLGVVNNFDDNETASKDETLVFLRELNQSWNEYIFNTLQLDGDNLENLSKIKARFSATRNKLELVGAQIRIPSCDQKKRLQGSFGILVSISKNTWKIWRMKGPGEFQGHASREEGASGGNNKQEARPASRSLVVVPKRGSSIDILVPLPSSSNTDPVETETRFLSIRLDPNVQDR